MWNIGGQRHAASATMVFLVLAGGVSAEDTPAVGNGAVPLPDAIVQDPAVITPPAPGNVVYKSVDANGKVIFTDQPPAGGSTEVIQVQNANKMPAVSAETSGLGGTEEKNTKIVTYKKVMITSPADDALFGQEEADAVTLSAQVEPPLREGDTLQLYYDGKPVGAGAATFTIQSPERGTHTVEAKVLNSKNKVLKASGKTQFHVRRISALNKLTAAQQATKGRQLDPKAPAGGFGAPKGFASPGDANAPKGAASGKDNISIADAGSLQDVGSPGTSR